MARKKKRWRDMDDPADIFGGERPVHGDENANDPAYDAFRRHIEEHIQGETRAFHELRSTAEHELQAAKVVVSTPRRELSPKNPVPNEPPKAPLPSMPPAALIQPQVKNQNKNASTGTLVMLGLVCGAIGFLLNSAWQQSQPLSRKASSAAKAKLAADPNCGSERVSTSKKNSRAVVKHSIPSAVPPAESTTASATPAPASSLETTVAADSILKGMTLRAVEMRRGPGSHFEIMDSLPPGFALEGALTTDRLWLRVKPGAFVSAEAVQFQDATVAGYQSFWVGPHAANIREYPLITARIVRKADPGTELKIQKFNAEWAQVSAGGFVYRKLLTSEIPRSLQLPALMRVAVEKAEIRGGPGHQYPVLGIYFRNHKVEVQEMQDGWLRIGPDQYIRAQEMELSAKPNSDKTM